MPTEAFDLDSMLLRPESQTLEWKSRFPQHLRGQRAERDAAKGTVLKDLAAMANGLVEGYGFMVYGVAESGSKRQVVGVDGHWDDATFQDWAQSYLDPAPRFAYAEYADDSGAVVGSFAVEVHPEGPHVAKRTIGSLHEGQVPVRYGTQNRIAGHEELRALFVGPEPMTAGSTTGAVVTAVVEHYRSRGLEPVLPRSVEREDKLKEGYRLALYPGTRRPVVVVNPLTNVPELILMLRP